MEEQNLQQALVALDTVCAMFDDRDWRYDKDVENLEVRCKATGDDLPIDIRFKVDAKREVVMFLSSLNFNVPEEKRAELSVATNIINNAIVAGSFDYSYQDGTIAFRLVNSYCDSLISKEVYDYMLVVGCQTVDEYNDKLLMICKGVMSLEDLSKFIGEE